MSDLSRVTLSGALPGEGLNGLRRHHDDLLANKKTIRLAVALVDVSGTGSNTDRDEEWPIVRLRQVEVIEDAGDRKTILEAMARALADRTGQNQLPFEPGEEAGPPEKASRRSGDAGAEAD